MTLQEKIDRNITDFRSFLRELADKYGDTPAVREYHGKELVDRNYLELKRDADAVSRFLLAQGAEERMHIAAVGATSYQYIAAYFGTVDTANVIVPTEAQLSTETQCELFHMADVTGLFFDKHFEDAIPEIHEKCPDIKLFICLTDGVESHDLGDIHIHSINEIEKEYAEGEEIIVPLEHDTFSTILFTSGTTSARPKAVMLCHGGIIDNIFSGELEQRDSTNKVKLIALPIHHALSFNTDICMGFRNGDTVFVNDSMLHIAKNFKVAKPYTAILVPMIFENFYHKIMKAHEVHPEVDLKAMARDVFGGEVEVFYCGGAHLRAEIADAFAEWGMPVFEGYGMTECSPRVAANMPWRYRRDSIGRVVDNAHVRIKDTELQVKSPSVMLGYYKDPEATKAAFTEDGWLKSGDIGYIDEDGFIFLQGRIKNLIILSNGENVSPEEIETKLYDCTFIKECLVYEENGQITAEVFPDAEYAEMHKVTDVEKEISAAIKAVNKSMPTTKSVRSVKFRYEPFERTATNKIKRTGRGKKAA
ncbi:long-chain acyl-CoA synthetase [Lachnospiraceae bacterium]|nr:long-chain acyl-CoA synthetase [Lachnospiraceae bacterium]